VSAKKGKEGPVGNEKGSRRSNHRPNDGMLFVGDKKEPNEPKKRLKPGLRDMRGTETNQKQTREEGRSKRRKGL